MNDDRSKPAAESTDAFPTPVNSQVTDSVESGEDDGGGGVEPDADENAEGLPPA
jgi:hypothetical protein